MPHWNWLARALDPPIPGDAAENAAASLERLVGPASWAPAAIDALPWTQPEEQDDHR
jgi:hypothetical protein